MATGTANDLMLTLYGRLRLSVLEIDGDRQVLERLAAW